MTLPQIRLQPWYPGQMGVSGSDVPRGIRWSPTSIVLYVDENHPGASADADGTDPENPLTTIALAITRLIAFATSTSSSLEGSVIVVGAGATIAESVTIPPTAPANCMLLGAGTARNAPHWTAATAAGTALTMQQEGWVVDGFQFDAGEGGTAITMQWVPGSGYVANRCVISNNHFNGAWAGLYGINLSGAPYDAWIIGNEFREYRRTDTTAHAIITTDSSEANAYMCVIKDNIFWENENHIGSTGDNKSFNLSLFQGNMFHDGRLIAATRMLDLRGGSQGDNIVVGNYFCGDYSNTGGYYANAGRPGNWVGNFAEDIAEPEVGTNGVTIAIPAP